MKALKFILSSLFIATLVFSLVGCSDDSSSSSASNLTGSAVSITDVNEAKLALVATNSIVELGSTDLSAYTDSDDIPQASPALSISYAPVNENVTCWRFGTPSNGTFSAVGDMSATSVNMTYTYDECWVDNNYRLIGTKTLSGTIDDNGLVTANISTTNYFMVGQYTMNTSSVAKFYSDGSPSNIDILLNGKIEHYYDNDPGVGETPIFYEDLLGYENFHYVADANGHETIDGKVSMSGSSKSCMDGIYTLETIEKIIPTDIGADGGIVKVNGTTFEFNNDSTVSLTFADDSTAQFNFADAADANCSE